MADRPDQHLPRGRGGELRRDRWGIPHLRADDLLSLAHLQGRVTARDRAWQVERGRWRAEGRTAEHLGAAGLGWDVFARQVRLEETARTAFARLDEETRAWVGAYVDGVNAELPAAAASSAELASLGLGGDDVRPWQPWTPLGVFWSQQVLFGTFPLKLFRARVAERLGPAAVGLFSSEGATGGSNAVGLAGGLTASGLPLVLGDPHRTVELPGVYSQVRLSCPGVDVAGFCFPGVPGVQHFGHAGSVAWAITNAMADYQDLYREQLRRDGSRLQVRDPDGWADLEVRTETVAVRGTHPVAVPVAVTARGPLVTGLDPAHPPGTDPAPAHSLRVPCQVSGDLGFGALLPLLRSRDVEDVTAALAAWVEPVNSVVVADRSGRLRHLLAGRVPRRDPRLQQLPGTGAEPADGWWPGWAERAVTDVADLVVSANDRASGGGLGDDYAAPHRAERLRRLVADRAAAGQPVGPAEAAQLCLDTRTGPLDVARPLLAAARVEGAAETLRRRLLAWDGHCGPESLEAGAWADWRHELVRWLVAHPALAPLRQPHPYPALLAPWLDLTARVGVAWERLLLRGGELGIDAAEGVRAALVAAAAREPAPWGERHRLAPLHALGWSDGTDVPVAGDNGSVLAAASSPGVDDRVVKGPVARYVWDLSDRGRSGWVVPFGAAGDPADPHHLDQLPMWQQGSLADLSSDWNDLEVEPV
ncbi:hypothetical protein GC722_12700 [Auraticoccus sp. F435]|uniref:Penicillin amidase n=1 Tax=Auraticoccus cholistanensis TaxID=2656650 RepID=A0A6A9UV94_9ACTN|nr:hypothetical protein [Auraticoccus cholistanensis]